MENELMQAIMNQLSAINSRLDKMDARLDRLEVGQTEIRKDIARLDTKIDTLSGDVGSAMAQLTENVDKEIIKLKIVK